MSGGNNLTAVVLCGGGGTRLWPLSTDAFPKPFVPLPGGETLIEKTYRRALALPGIGAVITIAGFGFKEHCKKEYAKIGSETPHFLLLEPEGRDTAAAVLLGALAARHLTGAESTLLILPADHLIENETAFQTNIASAAQAAERGRLATFGIPTRGPETGYGYVQAGAEIFPSVRSVCKFAEKPDLPTAERYHATPDFLWNSGMFCFRAETLLEEFAALNPKLYELGLKTWNLTAGPGEELVINLDFLSKMEKISFDFAVMEKTSKAAVVEAGFDWRDIGSWASFADLFQMDSANNSFFHDGEIFTREVENSLLYSSIPNRKIALVGVSDLVVIETEQGLLVVAKDKVQSVKDAAQYFRR